MLKRILSKRYLLFAACSVIFALCTLLPAVTSDTSTAGSNTATTIQTVSTWGEISKLYLSYRDTVYHLIPPSTAVSAEVFQEKGAEIQNTADWFWVFGGTTLYAASSGELSKALERLPVEIIIYEDLAKNEIVINKQSDDIKNPSEEEAVFTAPEWAEQSYEQSFEEYTATELGKRRVVLRITLQQLPDKSASTSVVSAAPVPMTMAMMSGGASISNIRFTVIEKLTNGNIYTEISYPVDYTNRLDIFTVDSGTGLLDFWWNLAVNATNVSTSTNYISWVDTDAVNAGGGVRFYAAANADINSPGVDEDHDSLSYGREHFLYHTSPTNSDTDIDGYSDYEEVINMHTDPNNNDTTIPSISLDSPENETERIVLP